MPTERLTAAELEANCLALLKQHNRPFTPSEMHLTSGSRWSKPGIERALEALAANGVIAKKIYGKSKIYCFPQDDYSSTSDSGPDSIEKQVAELTKKDAELAAEVKALGEENTNLQITLKKICSEPTTELARIECENLKEENKKCIEKLETLGGEKDTMSKEDKAKITKQYQTYYKQWVKRKRIVNDALDGILQSDMAPPKKKLIEDIGIGDHIDPSGYVPSVTKVVCSEVNFKVL
eukprot:UC4_evm1s1275